MTKNWKTPRTRGEQKALDNLLRTWLRPSGVSLRPSCSPR